MWGSAAAGHGGAEGMRGWAATPAIQRAKPELLEASASANPPAAPGRTLPPVKRRLRGRQGGGGNGLQSTRNSPVDDR